MSGQTYDDFLKHFKEIITHMSFRSPSSQSTYTAPEQEISFNCGSESISFLYDSYDNNVHLKVDANVEDPEEVRILQNMIKNHLEEQYNPAPIMEIIQSGNYPYVYKS